VESNFKPVECLKPWIHSYQEREAWILGDKVMAPDGKATKIDQQAKPGRSRVLCIQYTVAKKLGVTAIISYDKHFDGLDIPRLEPSNVVKRKEFKIPSRT